MPKEFIMVRPGKKSNTLEELSKIAAMPEYEGNQSAVVRDAIHEKYVKRIICVQHADGTREVDPEAK